jgi:hypothetical protein
LARAEGSRRDALASAARSEKIRMLFEQSGPVLWTNLAVSAIVSGTLSASMALEPLLVWMALVVVLVGLRLELKRRFVRAAPRGDRALPWARRFVAGSVASGALWGARQGCGSRRPTRSRS